MKNIIFAIAAFAASTNAKILEEVSDATVTPIVGKPDSVFDKNYMDPDRPMCKTQISVSSDGTTAELSGQDGESWNCRRPVRWGPVSAKIVNDTALSVDFSSRNDGPADLVGVYDAELFAVNFTSEANKEFEMIWWEKNVPGRPAWAYPTHECNGTVTKTGTKDGAEDVQGCLGNFVCMQKKIVKIDNENTDDIVLFKKMNKQFKADYAEQRCVKPQELETEETMNDKADSYGVTW